MAKIRRRSRADRRQSQEAVPETERRVPRVRELELRVERKSKNHVVLHMANEFITQNYYLLDEALERLSRGGSGLRIELEISAVPYADSEALGRLVFWSKKLAQTGASLVVVDPTPHVTSIMDLLHLDKALAIVHRHIFPSSEH